MEQDYIKQIQNLQQNINLLETISTITELTIFGDQKNQDLFEYVIYKFLVYLQRRKYLKSFLRFQKKQAITNITKNQIVLLSLPQLNEFIIFDYNLKKEEISDYYINLIKIISNKLNPKNINLFFNSKYCQFPLLLYSQNFFNSPDNLTRTYTRHLLLQILKITLESKQKQILIKYLQSYPFLQVLTNHMQFMKDLFLKCQEKDDEYDQEIKIMNYFFKDLSEIAPELKYILDNLFLQILILPFYKDLANIDDNRKTLCFQIILHFLQNEIYKSERLSFGILALIFSHEIPQIQTFEFEPNYLPVNDSDLKDICSQFFQQQQEVPLFVSKSVFLEKINYSLSFIPYLINYQSINPLSKQQQFENLLKNDMITNLQMASQMKNKYQYNVYNIYAQMDSLNSKHYYQVLNILDILVENRHIYQMTLAQKIIFLINLVNIMINEQEKELNTIENCKKTVKIVKELLSKHEKQFTKAFIRSNILKKMEIHFLKLENLYYKYFLKIQQCIEDENIEVFIKKSETHQIIRFLLLLNVIFEKGWLINTFKQLNYNLDFEEKTYKNGEIKLVNCQAIIEDDIYNIEGLEVEYDEKEDQIILVDVLDEKKIQNFNDKTELEDFCRELKIRQQAQEQHFIPEILKQLEKLYL
ncbi:unnamed protein product [Paramecium sonneborni]|uniref:FPL domain-containing protein n=1 Tax=Paramecium sonneborni TaxID=65129 RepID=A0A8S1QLH2_9CILI|nr:unnamed protein product [Paramecium sonneborni]